MTPDDVTLRFRETDTERISEYVFRSNGTGWLLDESVGPCAGAVTVSHLSVSPDAPGPLPDHAAVVWTEAGDKRKATVERTERANEWVVTFETWTGAKWHRQRDLAVADLRLDVAEVSDSPLASL